MMHDEPMDIPYTLEMVGKHREMADEVEDTDSRIRHLGVAIGLLLAVVDKQYEQIVDLNSRVEYGYTHKETH